MVHRIHPPWKCGARGRGNIAEDGVGYFQKGGDFNWIWLTSLNLDNQISHPLLQIPQAQGQFVIGTDHNNLVPIYWWLLSGRTHNDPILALRKNTQWHNFSQLRGLLGEGRVSGKDFPPYWKRQMCEERPSHFLVWKRLCEDVVLGIAAAIWGP